MLERVMEHRSTRKYEREALEEQVSLHYPSSSNLWISKIEIHEVVKSLARMFEVE